MGKTKNTADLTTLSPEELLAYAQEAQAKVAGLETALTEADKNVTAAEKEIAALTAEKSATDEKIGELIKEAEMAETKLSDLESKVEKQQKDLDQILADNEALQASLEEKPNASALPEVTHDKKKYVVMIQKFRHEGEVYTAEQLKKNPDLVASLIEMGSGVLKAKG